MLAYDAYWHYGSFLARGWEISLGRFLIPFSDILRGSVVGSFLCTFISLVILSFSSIFLIEALNIKKNYLKILVAILVVVTPTISLTLMYPYTSNGYTFAMLFAMLSIYFINKDKYFKNILFTLICVVATLAFYQAYLCVITTLLLISYIFKLIDNNSTSKELLKSLFIDIIIIGVDMVIYYIGLNIIIVILGHLDFSIQNESLLNLTNFDVSDVNIWTWQIFLQDHLGIGRNIYTMKNYTEIMNSEEFINMPIYPSDGCTKIINGTAVVKLNY